MLKVKKLYKSFGTTPVLKGVDFTILPGQIVGLVGTSGSGKTVLARSLVGLERPEAGEYLFDEQNVNIQFPVEVKFPWAFLRQHIGYVSQVRALPPYRTILDLVAEGPNVVKKIKLEDSRKIAKLLLRTFGLNGHENKFPGEVSGGQLARVCIARALAMEPKYLLCDEITANLDPIASVSVADVLVKASERGIGIVFISHQLGFLRQYGERIDFLNNGTIIESGPPKTLFRRPFTKELKEFIRAEIIAR
ncbi:MAG: ATP-binding cassette domain-containing protein [Bacteroidetes bacterium]|nr:ATP-binding cassette domain-containing protein [Bacteroidota bacterium]